MSAKRPGLFGHRPDLLLVDERPRGIDLSAIAAAPLPKLAEEPPPPPPPEDLDDTLDDDSYDGEGPLRIFIGAPKAATVAAAVVPAVDLGPVWDASSLALTGEDDVEDPSDALPTNRRPVLVKKGLPIEPPPLTMSFGGSFARGSLDAGVMDETTADSTGDPVSRGDSVIVHDDIFDRFLHFDDPTASPPARALPPQVIPPLESMDDEEMLAAAEADPDLGEDILQAGFDLPEKVEPGKPPTRLRVGFRGPSSPEPVDDDDADDGDQDDGPGDLLEDRLDLELGLDAEDESGPVVPQVRVGLASAAGREIPPVHDRAPVSAALSRPPAPSAEPPSAAKASPPADLLVLPPSEGDGAGTWSAEEPDWASRRRNSRATPGRSPAPAPAEASSGGGMGLLIFVVVAVGGLFLAWYLFGRTPTDSAADLPAVVPRHEGAVLEPSPTGTGIEAPAGAGASEATTPGAAPGEAPVDPAAVSPEAAPPPEAAVETVAADDPLLAQATPAQEVGSLRVRATRPSRVYVDGKLVGETPMAALTLAPGEHEIRVVAIDSGRTRSQIVRVDADRAQEVRFSF